MAEEKLLTVREAAQILELTEKEIIELSESGQLPAYKVGGVFLRFKREQIEEYKKKILKSTFKRFHLLEYPLKERFYDFIHFNDFYILAILIILWMLIIILLGR